MRKLLHTIVLLSSVLSSSSAISESPLWDQATWDLGIGMGVFDYALYPGSRASDDFIIPLPYITFRSPLLEIDRGIKGFLYSSDDVELDISADFQLPVDSDDSAVRSGMSDLDAVLQAGPSIEFLLSEKGSDFDQRIELPLRAAFATDIRDSEHVGWLLEPRYSIEHRRRAERGWSYKITAGVMLATDDYYAYYYDVGSADVTALRAAYDSSGGYGGAFLRLRSSYRMRDWVFWMYARYRDLDGASFEDSSLVETSRYHLLGVGFSWIFASN